MSNETPEPGMFATLIQTSLNAAVTPERVKEKVDAHVEGIIDEAISDAMRTYSGTGKAIKAAVEASLSVGDDLNLPSYGHVVSDILARQIQACVADVVAVKLSEDMEGLLKLAPKEAKLSDMIAKLLDGDSWEDGPTRVGLIIDGDDDYSHVWVCIGKGELTDKYAADIRLLIRLPKKLGEYEQHEAMSGTISTGTVKGTDLQKDTRFGWGTEHKNQGTKFGAWFGFEQEILAMYACGTVIELDEDSCILDKHDY